MCEDKEGFFDEKISNMDSRLERLAQKIEMYESFADKEYDLARDLADGQHHTDPLTKKIFSLERRLDLLENTKTKEFSDEDSTKPDTVKVLRIDLDKKNLLVINFPETDTPDDLDAYKDRIQDKSFKRLTEGLQEWIADKSRPFLCLGLYSGETVVLEKIGAGKLDNRVLRLEKIVTSMLGKVERIMKYMARA